MSADIYGDIKSPTNPHCLHAIPRSEAVSQAEDHQKITRLQEGVPSSSQWDHREPQQERWGAERPRHEREH